MFINRFRFPSFFFCFCLVYYNQKYLVLKFSLNLYVEDLKLLKFITELKIPSVNDHQWHLHLINYIK